MNLGINRQRKLAVRRGLVGKERIDLLLEVGDIRKDIFFHGGDRSIFSP